MKVTREQAAANREKIVEVAGALFRKHGFEGIGVADIMKAAGLTHGGFYGHFESKEDLAAEACARAFNHKWWASWTDVPSKDRLEAIVRGYLTPRHRSDRAHGCLIAAVGSEIVRQPRTVRRVFTEGFRSTVDVIRSAIPGRSATTRREQALATISGLVGALILSRAVDDSTLSDEILKAATKVFGRLQGEEN